MAAVNALEAYNAIFGRPTRGTGLGALKTATIENQLKADVAYWYGTMSKGAGAEWKTQLLFRMWTIIWHGGLWMQSGGSGPWQAWGNSNMPIAACLSHGGRVLVQLTRDAGDDTVWRWFWGAQQPQARHAATHGVKFGLFGDMPDGRPKFVMETKSGQAGTHFGVDMAGGGKGNTNPISGNLIKDDGRHGHLYMCYVKPTTERRGALMFGAEDTSPIDRAQTQTNQVVGGILGNTVLLPFSLLDLMTGGGWKRQPLSPGLRSIFPKGQTGAYHALGVSGDYSLTGSKKFKDLAKEMDGLPDGNDQIFVNPPVDVWQKIIGGTLKFRIEDLGNVPPRNEKVVRVMPTVQQFKTKTSGGAFHTRNKTLVQMDTVLGAYHGKLGGSLELAKQRDYLLFQFAQFGAYYAQTSNDPPNVKKEVAAFTTLAHQLSETLWGGPGR